MRKIIAGLFAIALMATAASARAANAPAEIKIGTLYASSGPFASISMPVHYGLKLWIDQKNAEGGVFVKPYNKKIPIKLVAYDDQSSTGTAATLYNQLITQDKVDILIADSGSVLTSVAVPIARDHKMLLIDQTGTGAAFFTKDNPYIVLMSDPVSSIWPKYIADFLTKDGPGLGIKRIALLYSTNDFTGTQATNPDAVIELGYPNNDISFLRNLQDSGVKFKWLFTIYPGLETELLEKNVGAKGLAYVYTYVPSSELAYKAEVGMSLAQFREAWHKKYADGKVEFGFNSVAGYTTGLVLEKALAETDSMDQLALRKAIFALSGKLHTLDGTFALDETGAQIGEITPLGQLVPEGSSVKFVTVYPHDVATGKPVYPAP